jgi:drug/metabolite transporter (DMT)-like permease
MTVLGFTYLVGPALLGLRGLRISAVPAAAWVAVAYYGLVPTVLGFVWWYRGAAHVSGAEAGVFTAMLPLSGAGLSALVLGEPLLPRHLLALVLVVAAVALVARGHAAGASPPTRRSPRPNAPV